MVSNLTARQKSADSQVEQTRILARPRQTMSVMPRIRVLQMSAYTRVLEVRLKMKMRLLVYLWTTCLRRLGRMMVSLRGVVLHWIHQSKQQGQGLQQPHDLPLLHSPRHLQRLIAAQPQSLAPLFPRWPRQKWS